MYIICTYDVNEKKCSKVMKVLRQYLFHAQNSVFEGTLTPQKFKVLKQELNKIIDEEDSVLFYISYNEKQIYKQSLNDSVPKFNILM